MIAPLQPVHHTVPYVPGISAHLPGRIWRDLASVRDALNAGVTDPAALQLVVACPCNGLAQLLDLGEELALFEVRE